MTYFYVKPIQHTFNIIFFTIQTIDKIKKQS